MEMIQTKPADERVQQMIRQADERAEKEAARVEAARVAAERKAEVDMAAAVEAYLLRREEKNIEKVNDEITAAILAVMRDHGYPAGEEMAKAIVVALGKGLVPHTRITY